MPYGRSRHASSKCSASCRRMVAKKHGRRRARRRPWPLCAAGHQAVENGQFKNEIPADLVTLEDGTEAPGEVDKAFADGASAYPPKPRRRSPHRATLQIRDGASAADGGKNKPPRALGPAPCPHPPHDGCGRRPGHHARGPHPRYQEGAGKNGQQASITTSTFEVNEAFASGPRTVSRKWRRPGATQCSRQFRWTSLELSGTKLAPLLSAQTHDKRWVYKPCEGGGLVNVTIIERLLGGKAWAAIARWRHAPASGLRWLDRRRTLFDLPLTRAPSRESGDNQSSYPVSSAPRFRERGTIPDQQERCCEVVQRRKGFARIQRVRHVFVYHTANGPDAAPSLKAVKARRIMAAYPCRQRDHRRMAAPRRVGASVPARATGAILGSRHGKGNVESRRGQTTSPRSMLNHLLDGPPRHGNNPLFLSRPVGRPGPTSAPRRPRRGSGARAAGAATNACQPRTQPSGPAGTFPRSPRDRARLRRRVPR